MEFRKNQSISKSQEIISKEPVQTWKVSNSFILNRKKKLFCHFVNYWAQIFIYFIFLAFRKTKKNVWSKHLQKIPVVPFKNSTLYSIQLIRFIFINWEKRLRLHFLNPKSIVHLRNLVFKIICILNIQSIWVSCFSNVLGDKSSSCFPCRPRIRSDPFESIQICSFWAIFCYQFPPPEWHISAQDFCFSSNDS